MGALYLFRCPKCDPPRTPDLQDDPFFPDFFEETGTPLGVGLNYPYVCKSIYEEIRGGKQGVEARRALRWMLRPGIYHSRDVHVCQDCEKWRVADTIKICRLKKGKSDRGTALDAQRDAQAGPWLKPLCRLDPEKWDVVWENSHSCSHCGGRMQPGDKYQTLRCNRCGGPLEVTVTGHWD